MRSFLTTVTLVLSVLCAAVVTDQKVCTGEDTNYTRYDTKTHNMSYQQRTKTVQVVNHDCWVLERVFWFFIDEDKCRTRYTTKYYYVTLYRQDVNQVPVIECCPGYVRDENDTCSKGCERGKYGTNCTKNCSCSNQDLFCDMETGVCLCDAGFTGENCTDECDTGLFGSNCTHKCICENNSTCDSMNGACNCTTPGWEGDACSQECSNGTYGLNCEQECMCNENQTCDHVIGACTCKPGWKGDNCSHECEGQAFGEGCNETCTCNLNNTDTCDHVTGQCHCKLGYMGCNCSQECPFGSYGDHCSSNCSDVCTGTSYCDHVDGTCICISSKGVNCTEDCVDGWYGLNCSWPCLCNHSNSNESCDRNGHCFCKAGWTSPTCEKECPLGLYGPNCTENCTEKCAGNVACDRFNGTCVCVHSKGENCTEDCAKGFYGHWCQSVCQCQNYINSNGSCNKTGGCFCKDGWTGSTCEQAISHEITDPNKQTSDPDSFVEENMLYIVIPVVALLLVILVIVFVICWRRARARKRLKENEDPLVSTAQDNPNYTACEKEDIPLTHSNSESNLHMYEEAVLETENQSELANNHVTQSVTNARDSNIDHESETENYDHAYAESKVVSECMEEDDYSVPDRSADEKTEEKDEENKDDDAAHQEELYDCTDDHIQAVENNLNDYNTFQDVLKISKEVTEKETGMEEDYDVITHSGSKKMKPTDDHPHYSSFEEVRKLSLQNAEEDMYNELNDEKKKQVSTPVTDNRYHHISLKYKTIDGESIENTALTSDGGYPKRATFDRELSKQTSLRNASIDEESEDEEENAKMSGPRKNSLDEAIKKKDITEEVIYDECDIDENTEEPEQDMITTKTKAVSVNSDSSEVIYEECDGPEEEQSRPPSGVLYDDVDDEETEKAEVGKEEETPTVTVNKERPHLKRASERRREDYEDFAL